MKKSVHIFFTIQDEANFSAKLLQSVPSIRFVDDCYWESPEPPLLPSIDRCKSNLVLLWDSSILPTLPFAKHPDGMRYHGPQSGIVIQFIRPRLRDQELTCGTLSVGIESTENREELAMKKFAGTVWKVLESVCDRKLLAVSRGGEVLTSNPPLFRLGKYAATWSREGSGRVMRDRTANNIYSVAE